MGWEGEGEQSVLKREGGHGKECMERKQVESACLWRAVTPPRAFPKFPSLGRRVFDNLSTFAGSKARKNVCVYMRPINPQVDENRCV